jgi:CubicO group peptidase (beta-lactamase class C family)
MRRLLLFTTTIALLLASVPSHGQALSYAPTYAFDVFGAYLESLRVQAGIPGLAAAVVGEDSVLWEHAYGRQDLGRAIATRTDTPFHVNGLTETLTASIVLRCVEDRRLSLDDRIGQFLPDSPDANATIQQVLTHTSSSPAGLVFAYRPERLDPLRIAVAVCTGNSYRDTLAALLQQFAMFDSVPGADIVGLVPPAEGSPDPADADRYAAVLQRIATPYAVDSKGRALLSQYSATTLTASNGLISTVRDYAKFDLALRQGLLLSPDTLASAWRAPVGPLSADGKPLPHGLGWFVQSYDFEPVVWQFGLDENASSALVMTVPARKLTLILMANSDRLVKPLPLAAGDLTASPFGKLFLSFFVR